MKKTFYIAAVAFSLFISSFISEAAFAACAAGEWKCSGDAYTLSVCEGGDWKNVACMQDRGQLCEAGACVDPWRYGSPAWRSADDEPLGAKETLAEKARYYEELSARLHVNPNLKWIMGVELPCKPAPCAAPDRTGCKDCAEPAISLDTATWKDVEKWMTNENDGLWSALYLTAEAFRYAVTKDEAALRMIKLLLEGEVDRMNITGVPGIFTRQYITPGVPGISCPAQLEAYMPDREKDDNKWVKVGDDGCVQVVDPATREWVATKHCGLKQYAGWCWLDNVSKDEYTGHMLALGAAAKLVDDPQVQSVVKGLLLQVGLHLIENKMAFIDWDGRITEHGRIYAVSMGDYPGFNAAMALDFIKIAADATGDPRLESWYADCLLQKSGKINCLKRPFELPRPYTYYIDKPGMFPGSEGCKANYNNVSMHMLSLHNLIWFEHDPKLREAYQHSLDADVFRAPGQPRAVANQNNAFFDFIFAAQKRLGPGSDGPAYGAVENGIRMLRQFPARKTVPDLQCPPDKCQPYCKNRFGEPTGGIALMAAERCPDNFLWWGDPYDLLSCRKNNRLVQPPADYLLAYWMGRYYGFISEDM
jgi:hypothetical protein